jgi:ATP-dependent DNA ligase
MLTRSGPLPQGADRRFELKLDGFRAIVSTRGDLPRDSRSTVSSSPSERTGSRAFRVCERMLHRRPGIPVAYMIFDVLERDGLATLNWPYRQRRELLEELDLHGSHWDTAMAFEDGERLFRCAHEIGLEGVVAKKLSHRYRPGERLWVKVKNRDYWKAPESVAGRPRCSRLGNASRVPRASPGPLG